MSYEVSIQENQDFIRVEVTGERVSSEQILETAQQFWTQMLDLCDKKGVHRLLAIFDMKGDLPTVTGYEPGEWVAKIGLNTKVRVAFVDLNKESREINRFVENVAVNRSLDPQKARVFGDEQSAIEWLLKGQMQTGDDIT